MEEAEAVTLMTGRTIERMYPELPRPAQDAEVALDVRDLRGTRVDGVSFQVRRGEILGVGGLAGQGQRDLFMTLFAARRPSGGEISVGGKRVRLRNPHDAIDARLGIALVPEDRKSEGLMLPLSVRDNLSLVVLSRVSTGGVVRRLLENRMVWRMVERLQIRTRRVAVQEVGTLSGGNQQKVVVAREFRHDLKLLVIDQPTRGLDVGSIEFIHKQVIERRDAGVGVLLVSAELDEVLDLSDRILVMYRGRIVGSFAAAEAQREKVGLLMATGEARP
jgi:ABC-type sugar transport system ATPase subunit